MNENNKDQFFKFGSWTFIVLAVFLAVHTLSALKGLNNADPMQSTISVMGEGEVSSIPDIASFYFTVSADADSPNEAQTLVTEKMNAVLAALENLGVDEKDIKTADYSLWPKYRYETDTRALYPQPGNQVPDGYTASHNVTVKVRNTSDAGKLLAAVGESGATNISGLNFTTDDPQALYDEARSMAIADAKAKAKVLSEELGVKLVRVVSYNDSSGGYPMPYYYEQGFGGDTAVRASAPSIPSGENETKVMVTIIYEIR